MTHVVPIEHAVTDAEIRGAIQASWARRHRYQSIAALHRRPWEYATSAAAELVTVVMDDETACEFVLKHLGPQNMSEGARRAKPSFVVDPQREIEVYRRLLAPFDVGAALVGSKISPQTGSYWLLIEHVRGRRLFEIGEPERWASVAGWLAGLHRRLATLNRGQIRHEARLIEYDREWYTVWMQRALRFFASSDPPQSRLGRVALRLLADRYDKIVERLTSLPPVIIHGEFYASNILVGTTAGDPLVCPVDWEMTAIGPGIIDLAALTSGTWQPQDRRSMIAAYVAGSGLGADTIDQVTEDVEYARIHLAVQWLGWFGRRRSIGEHAHDWLADAVERAEALRL